jgi:hypothetical protein
LTEWIGGSQLADFDDIDLGAADLFDSNNQIKSKASEFDNMLNQRVNKTFMYHNRGPRFSKVEVCGSFDDWNKRH